MKKDLGAILLISGTTIGAGMLALPSITSPLGLILSLSVYVGVFFIMLYSAKYFVKLVLHYQKPYNFVDLAKHTLGLKGKIVCWILYLLLMYALVAAYISALSSMLSTPIFSQTFLSLLIPIGFILFMNFGLSGIDKLNRLLMMGLILSFCILCIILGNTATPHFSSTIHPLYLQVALPIVMTAFGYHIIIPTIANYLDRHEKKILRAIFYGSIIPLSVYILWHLLIYFNLSQNQLSSSFTQDTPITDTLAQIHPKLKLFATSFAFFALITSFLGVTLSLFEFLKDSLPGKPLFKNKKILFSLTFIPPIIYIFYFKKAFYLALDHAGILVCLLLIIFPALAYLKTKPLSRLGPLVLLIIGSSIIIADILNKLSS
jgi:tyrosine-specific transport protein